MVVHQKLAYVQNIVLYLWMYQILKMHSCTHPGGLVEIVDSRAESVQHRSLCPFTEPD